MTSMAAVTPSAASNGTTDQITPDAEEKGQQQKASNHKLSAQDVGGGGEGGGCLSRPQVSDCLPAGACSDASACPSATQLYTTTALPQSQQPQSIDDWMTARKLFWRASPGQATKCGAIALPKKVYAYLGSALSKEHLSARRLTAADDQTTTCNPSQPSVPSNRNQDTTAPTTASESLSTPPPTPFYLVPPSSSAEDISAPPIKQLRLMCSGIPYASEATSLVSNSPPAAAAATAAAAAAAQEPKRKPKKKKKQPTEVTECRRTPRIRKTGAPRGSGPKEEYAGTRLTCNMNSFARDHHRLPVAEGRLLTR